MKTFTVALCLLFAAGIASAQDGKFEWEDEITDFEFEERLSPFKKRSPYIQLYGGLSSLCRYEINEPFKDHLSGGVTLGMERHRTVLEQETIAKRSASEFYLSYHTPTDGGDGTFGADVWRFGLGGTDEYGYRFTSDEEDVSGIYLGSGSSGLHWATVSANGLSADSAQNVHLLRFTDGLRFGESSTASLNVRVAEPVSLGVRYDWAQIYPRHMFWYWGLSGLIEVIASAATDGFIKAIGKSSPVALPIMHFILSNAVNFRFKALRQNRMNWPFNTEAPLNIQTYSVSIGVHF